jgi:hypothetical protein
MKIIKLYQHLNGAWHEIFDFRFFTQISFPLALSILLGPFWIFTKIRRDIRNLVDTNDKMFTGVKDSGGIFSPVSLLPVIKLHLDTGW